ncbi:MAG: erythromycin esterase family protein [Anaerolineaceae bacterium]|jgi:erythromycin esterase
MDKKLITKLGRLSHPIQSFALDADQKDLLSLKEILKGARIVALGEASHGTREHFQFKNRVIRFLMEEMGFRYFMIEASQWECKNIEDYVLMGKGNKYEALESQRFWTWRTEEVMELIDWMRAHNLSCPRGKEVHFLGFDMQIMPNILKYLETLGQFLPARDKKRLNNLLERTGIQKRTISEPRQVADAYWLHGWVNEKQYFLREKLGFQVAKLMEEASRTLVQYELMTVAKDPNAPRDYAMSQNITDFVNALDPSEKVILWAHDGHIGKRYFWENVGYWLSERYGSQYYALGFGLWGGQFQSRLCDLDNKIYGELMVHDIPPFPDYCWENDLRKINKQDYYIDLRSNLGDSEIKAWAEQTKPMIMLDEGWDPGKGVTHYEAPFVLSEVFDGMVFTHHTHSAIGIPPSKEAK